MRVFVGLVLIAVFAVASFYTIKIIRLKKSYDCASPVVQEKLKDLVKNKLFPFATTSSYANGHLDYEITAVLFDGVKILDEDLQTNFFECVCDAKIQGKFKIKMNAAPEQFFGLMLGASGVRDLNNSNYEVTVPTQYFIENSKVAVNVSAHFIGDTTKYIDLAP